MNQKTKKKGELAAFLILGCAQCIWERAGWYRFLTVTEKWLFGPFHSSIATSILCSPFTLLPALHKLLMIKGEACAGKSAVTQAFHSKGENFPEKYTMVSECVTDSHRTLRYVWRVVSPFLLSKGAGMLRRTTRVRHFQTSCKNIDVNFLNNGP